MKSLITSFFLFFTLSAMADPECDYHFQVGNATLEIMDNSQVVQQNLTVNRGKNSPDGRCKLYRVFFSKGLANNYQRKAFSDNGSSINYNLHQAINQSGILKDFGDAVTSNEFIEGQAPEKNTNYLNHFFVSVPGLAGNVIRSGIYSDNIQISIYGFNENSGNYLFEETGTLTVLFFVSKKLQVSLLDEGGAFDPSSTSKVLDFGYLTQNAEKAADLRVLSNGPYQIKISSQNNGRLKLAAGDTISYSLKVNNTNVALSGTSSSPVAIGSGTTTTNAGDKFNLKVRITEGTQNKSAGQYQDILTITAIAN